MNNRIPKVFLLTILLACTISKRALAQSPTEKAMSLAKVVSAASKSGEFDPVSAEELKAVETLFQRTILRIGDLSTKTMKADADYQTLVAEWHKLRMELTIIQFQKANSTDQQQNWWVLKERDDAKRGRGLYLFNPLAEARQLAIQAPHSFFDKHTRAINVRMFETGRIAAAAWNTIRRSEVDLAHHRFHYLNAFTSAWANAHSNGSIVQLHGFSNDKRQTKAGKVADLIVSDGTRYPSAQVRRLAITANEKLNASSHTSEPLDVMLYPFDCDELGATSNSQGKLLRAAGQTGFVHLEMSPALRERLRRNASVTDDLLKSILSTYRQ